MLRFSLLRGAFLIPPCPGQFLAPYAHSPCFPPPALSVPLEWSVLPLFSTGLLWTWAEGGPHLFHPQSLLWFQPRKHWGGCGVQERPDPSLTGMGSS